MPAARTAVCGEPTRQTTFSIEADVLSWRWNRYAAPISINTSSAVVSVPVVVSVGGAHAARIHGVAFSIALMARDACFPCTLTLGKCCRHGGQEVMSFNTR
jgi:hypothetical protein